MNKKKIVMLLAMLFVLMVGAFVATLLYSGGSVPIVSEIVSDNKVHSEPSYRASLEKEKVEETYYSMDLEYPKGEGIAEVTDYVDMVRNDFFDLVPKSDVQASYDNVTEERSYVLKMDTTVYTSTSTITYKIQTYVFTGGAHGGTVMATFTYDKNGKYLSLDDILINDDSLTLISRSARTYFNGKLRGQTSAELIDSGTAPVTDNFSSWYVTDTVITFIFQEYQLGSYALGIQEFPISRTESKNYLKI